MIIRRTLVAVAGAAMLATGLGGNAWALRHHKNHDPCSTALINHDPHSRFVGNVVSANCSNNGNDTTATERQTSPSAQPSAQPSASDDNNNNGSNTVELTHRQFVRLCRAADFHPRICRSLQHP